VQSHYSAKYASDHVNVVSACFRAAEMSTSNAIARHQHLLARVHAAPADLAVLTGLMREFEALTESINSDPSLSGDVRLHAINSQLFLVLMQRISSVFMAACTALNA
jgi:hypothetical protein